MDNRASLTRRGVARFLIGALVALCLAVPALAGPGEQREEKDEAERVAKKVERAQGNAHQAKKAREALRHFQEDVAKYADFHTKLLAKLASREESIASQKSFAHAIETERSEAKPGDIFRPEVQPLFRRLLAEQLQGPDTRDAQRAVLEGNPGLEASPVRVVVRVNAVYPPGAAQSTVPTSVLATLPPLPAPLEYRFVGRDLILLDSVADLIVDFLPGAAPDPTTKELP